MYDLGLYIFSPSSKMPKEGSAPDFWLIDAPLTKGLHFEELPMEGNPLKSLPNRIEHTLL